jgi:O-acetyl-ADP-ribose deacetylase (regulator of RNase III)
MLKRAKGNLIDMAEQGLFDCIVHGCNCQNTMGSGIAKEMRERYPAVYEADTIATEQWRHPIAKLGNFSTYTTNGKTSPLVIVNAYTQVHYFPRDIDHFEYESFYLILKKLEVLGPVNFGFPYIGMGLAGGDSTRIIAMLENFAAKITELGGTVTLVEFG